ncbi:MAG: hypothetical protein B7Z73_04810, partial [Planctomycetia bacterium 21-64-5]
MPVTVNDSDGPAQLAAAIAAAIDGAAGFGSATLAASSGDFVTVQAQTVTLPAGELLSAKNVGLPAAGNIAIDVNSTDGPVQLAAAAAAAINAYFNTPGLVVTNGSALLFRSEPVVGATSAASSGLLMDVYVPVRFLATDSAAQIAQDVVKVIGGTVGSGSPTSPTNSVTLTGSLAFGALPTLEDTNYTFNPQAGTGVTVTDPDITGTNASNSALQYEEIVTVRSGSGVLHVSNTSGITFLGASSNNQTSLDFQGTLDAINQALDGLQFIPADEYVGPVQIAFFTNDHGNIGVGPAPTFSPSGVALFSQEEDVHLAVLDVFDAPTLATAPLTLTAINETPANPPTPPVPAPNGGNTVYQILASNPPGGNTPAETLVDLAGGAKFGIAVTSATVANAPAGAPGGTWQYSLDGGNTWLNMSGLSPQHALLLDGGDGKTTFGDLVRFLPAANFNSSFGTPQVTFNAWDQTAALNPNMNVLVNLAPGGFADLTATGVGTGGSTPFSTTSATASLSVVAVNDKPTVAMSNTSFTTKEDTAVTLTGISVNDFDINEGSGPNNGQISVTVSLSDSTKGALSLSPSFNDPNVAVSGAVAGQLTLQGPLSDVNGALGALTFTPVTDFAGPLLVSVFANDLGNGGLGGAQTSATVTGSINVTAVHQAPVLYPTGDGVAPVTGNLQFTAVAENASAATNGGTSVHNLLISLGANSIYQDGKPPVNTVPQPAPFLDLDVDASAKEGIAIIGLNTQNGGIWQYSLDGGNTWISILSALPSNALVLPGGANGGLVRFQPVQNYISDPKNPPSLSVLAWDQTDGAASGQRVYLSGSGKTGGNTAYSLLSSPALATVAVGELNQPPSFAMSSSYSTWEDNTVAASGSQHGRNNLPISVPNFVFSVSPGLAGESVSFNVTANNPALFSTLPYITLDPNATTGTLHFTLTPDQFGVAALTVTATNSGSGNNTSAPLTANIVVTGINDPPTIDTIAPQQAGDDGVQRSVSLTGISAGLDESQILSITAVSSNPTLVPNPTVSYTNPNDTGTLFYTPTAGVTGTATITVTVTDNGGTANGGVNTVTETFAITVTNVIPTATPQNVTVAENTQQLITLGGTPPTGASYSLTATITSLPTNGTLYLTPDGSTSGSAITAVNTTVTNNEVIYVPSQNITGSDSFNFTPDKLAGESVLVEGAAEQDGIERGAKFLNAFKIRIAPNAVQRREAYPNGSCQCGNVFEPRPIGRAAFQRVRAGNFHADSLDATRAKFRKLRFEIEGWIDGGNDFSGSK